MNNERAGIVLQGGGGAVEATIGKVKYLNGGLFEETDEDKDSKVRVADAPFNQIFDKVSGLFEAFNFTITESTPLDIEIAVDPEMLGKIFEELVTGRHDSGSYYTPKPIVSFMCREALKGYLETQVPEEDRQALTRFIDKHEPDEVRNAEAVLNALRRVTVCDPACGSGAYLLGMMHELLDLRQCLFQTRQVDNKTMYQRKLDVIQTNIYGVDIAEFAVNIARLRLWLSLAVDYDGPEPQPLPNLDYKIEVGDSVCSPSPGALQMGLQQGVVNEFLQLKARYLLAHHGEKPVLRAQVDELKRQIMAFSNRTGEGFDWVVDFAEVFVHGGFDIMLANPPYVRQELITETKPRLAKIYPAVYDGRADLYCYFYARAIEVMKAGGMLTFISSNKWFRSKYGAKLRALIAEEMKIASITDFGELPVFENAATFPMIFIAQKSAGAVQEPVFTEAKSLNPPYPDIGALVLQQGTHLTASSIAGKNWVLASGQRGSLVDKMKRAGVPLKEYVRPASIYSGIKSGFNDAFWIDKQTRTRLIAEDSRSKKVIKSLARGDDVRKWTVRNSGLYLIYTHAGVDINQFPAIKKYLLSFRERLEGRAVAPAWWALQQAQYRDGIWDSPKIIYPDIGKISRFTLDTSGVYSNEKAFILPSADLYLLALLNSAPVWFFLRQTCPVLGDPNAGGRLQLKRQYVEEIPIPSPSFSQRKKMEMLAQSCLDKQGEDCEEEESQINAIAFGLFDITEEQVSE